MARSIVNNEVIGGDLLKKSIENHLPKKQEFTLTELQEFLRGLSIEALQVEITSIIQVIIMEYPDCTDDMRPILSEKNDEIAFRFGCL